MSSTKRSYTCPQLVRHSDVDEITKAAGAGFADVPFGNRGQGKSRGGGRGRGNGPPPGRKPWFPTS